MGERMLRVLTCVMGVLFWLTAAASEVAEPKVFRVMSYNIHHAEGRGGKIDVERIAELIKAQNADIVALQEVDRGVARTGRRDLIAELARLTEMNFCFGKNIDYQGGDYGNAILTRFPILESTNTHYRMLSKREQRGLLAAVLEVDGQRVLFLNTHLDYLKGDAQRLANVTQVKELLKAYPGLPVILCGDFNDTPGDRTYNRLSEFLQDAWKEAGERSGFTFPSADPAKRIDYIWISKQVQPIRTWLPDSKASDHLPIVAEFSMHSP
jgi:endonuclease/exonuclease/phosphatase family metal-dependent hydrolase